MAELFLANVAHAATEVVVTEALARVLHTEPVRGYSSGASSSRFVFLTTRTNAFSAAPVNFSVNVFTNKSKKNGRLATNANVTVADADLAERFLRYYGASGLSIKGRTARCWRSNRPVDPVRVRELRTNPFVSPSEERERQNELSRLQEPIPLARVEFGRISSGQRGEVTFNRAYSHRLVGGKVSLDSEKLELVVSSTESQPTIRISLSSIKSSQAAAGASSVLLSLSHGPTYFDRPGRNRLLEQLEQFDPFGILDDAQLPPRQRCSSLGDEHAQVAAFSSLHLLLVFPSIRDAEIFCNRRSKRVRLPQTKQVSAMQVRDWPLLEELRRLKPRLARLDLRIAFQLELLLHNGFLDPRQVLDLVPTTTTLAQSKGAEQTERILSRFATGLIRSRGERWDVGEDEEWHEEEDDYLDPQSLPRPFDQRPGQLRNPSALHGVDLVQQLQAVAAATHKIPTVDPDDTNRIYFSRHVILLPSGMRLEGPLVDESNSILRQYPDHLDHFLRVSIRDEDASSRIQPDQSTTAAYLKSRFGPIFSSNGGLALCGRNFSFLGYSQSALKEHSTFFVAPFVHQGKPVTAKSIRASVGDLSRLTVAARYMARLAQAFTATTPALTLTGDQVDAVDDIESASGSCFTDGVGKISPALADEVNAVLAANKPEGKRRRGVKSTCFQVRLGGAKGMLAVDPLLKAKIVILRPSQVKYNSLSTSLDIAGTFERPLACYLNRPLIKLLEDLKIPTSVFLDLQDKAVESFKLARDSLQDAATMLDRVGLGTVSKLSSTFLSLSRFLDVPASQIDPFLEVCVDVAVADALRSLKLKARIPVPGSYTLVGIADEDGYLKEGEIYACIKVKGKLAVYISGDVCISRSPSVHPGDVQVARAVGKLPEGVAPRLRGLHNCVVFATKGSRSLPSCLGGGDLDGDLYSLILLDDLVPDRKDLAVPASYDASGMKELGRPATIDDGVGFFLEYILADIMGQVANRHLQLADYYDEGTRHPNCIYLAKLHSDAVDYPKTGIAPAYTSLPKSPSQLKPNFMVPEYWAHKKSNNKRYYTSDKALGKLFRAIPLKDTAPKPWKVDDERLDPSRTITDALIAAFDLTPPPSSDPRYSVEMHSLLDSVCAELFHIAHVNTLSKRPDRHLSEVEVLLGTLCAPAKNPKQRQNLVARLQLQTRELFEYVEAVLTTDENGEEAEPEEQIVLGWAAWCAALDREESEFGVKPFGYVALQVLLDGVRRLEGREELG
ncbi:hypothetical protein JCM8097_009029 [Rhodosporidiobolus ruineniae]